MNSEEREWTEERKRREKMAEGRWGCGGNGGA